MLDPRVIRADTDRVRAALARKGEFVAVDEFLRLDEARRRSLTETESRKATLNAASKEIGALKRAGQDAVERMAEMAALRDQIRELDGRVAETDEQLESLLLRTPNTPHPSVPDGADENSNVIIRHWGEPRKYDFRPKPHWELGGSFGTFEFERATRITGVGGVGFPLLTGGLARLTRALMSLFLDLVTRERGYTEVWAPALASRASMTGTAQLPKMEEDMYHVTADDLFLIPTGEVPLTNFYREEILDPDQLPVMLTGYTPCFRREAGAAGKDTRGLLRVHQFDKVELVRMVRPEESYDHLEALTQDAEACLQRLGLAYRVVSLAAGDLSFASAKTYDLEVYAPGVDRWLEVSSCSNFESFQARRAGIRFRPDRGARPEFVHTLNGSGLGFPRTMAAVLETYQCEDGSVTLPDALIPYLDRPAA